MDWLKEKMVDGWMWLFDATMGDPTGAIAMSLFMIALFTFKPTRIFAIASTLIYILIL